MSRVLMVSSEASPFAQTGGLAEVVEALSRALGENGQKVAVVLPLYARAAVSDLRLIYKSLQFGMGSRAYSADVFEKLHDSVRYLFVHIPELYDRDQFYAEHDTDYADNHLRFGALCHAALGIARYVFEPDIFHCHDWQTALLPFLLKHVYGLHPAYLGSKSVLTIHNLGYQGIFDPAALRDLGLPDSLFQAGLLEFRGKVNILKAGIAAADVLTTVSPRYAQEIQTAEFGLGLETVLRSRSANLFGILNGIDYSVWNPATDPTIAANFDEEHLEGKQGCKRALLAHLAFSEDRSERPLLAIVSRLAEQKGLDLLMQIHQELMAEDVSLVVLGSGEQRFEDFFRWLAATYPANVAVQIGYEDAAEHRICAGADLMLMPSRYEPCGLTQMHCMRYGTLPLVHATGGLDNTVDENSGFKFDQASGPELLRSIRSALQVYGTARWREMMRAAMQQRYSWQASASEYIQLYQRLTGSTKQAAEAGAAA